MQLRETSTYALCTTCHAGSVSTDVIHGRLNGAGTLNGGGFESVNGVTTTSSHTVDGLPVGGVPSDGIGTAWGSHNGDGVPVGDVGVGVSGTLECTSCHNPHGSTNYRILNDRGTGTNPAAKWVAGDVDLLDWVNYQVIATRDDAPNYGFTTSVSNCPAAPTVPAGTATPYVGFDGGGSRCMARYTSGVYSRGTNKTAVPDFTKGMNAFCATCHKGYMTGFDSPYWNSLGTPVLVTPPTGTTPTWVPGYPIFYPGTQDAQDGHGNVERFRHPVARTKNGYPKQPLRFAARGTDPNPPGSLTYDVMGCLTCHFAHGSAAAATGEAAGVAPTNDSALLFYDNRGVCISCHMTVGGVPTLTPTAAAPTATATPVP